MKWLALFLSFFFLVTHELVPHRHHEELSESEHQKEHQSANNLVDFFSLVFHQNLGSHHLQEMVVASSKSEVAAKIELDKENIQHDFLSPKFKISSSFSPSNSELFFQKVSLKSTLFHVNHQRRGPPVG
jgi:hypothetical protein